MVLITSSEYVSRINKHVPKKYRRAVASILWWDLSVETPVDKAFNPNNKRLSQMRDGFDKPFSDKECKDIRDSLILIGYPEDEADKRYDKLKALSKVSRGRSNEGI